MTTRRDALVALGTGMASIPFAARAQPARALPRLGVLHPASVEASTVYKCRTRLTSMLKCLHYV